jgi:WD40 repeat protein
MAKPMLFAAFVLVGCLACGIRSDSAQPPAGTAPAAKGPKPIPDPRARPAAKVVAADSLGDPLPEGARLRLGTLRFRPPSSVVELALSPDQRIIVTVGRELIAWDASSGKELWRADPRQSGLDARNAAYGVRALAFAPDSTQFYTPGKPNEVVIWEASRGTHKVLKVKSPRENSGPTDQAAQAIDVSPDGQTLALGRALGVVVCDLQGTARYDIANVPTGPADFDRNDRLAFAGHYSLGRFSPDGKLLAVVTSDHPDLVRVCDANTGRPVRALDLASRMVRLTFSPDSKYLATTERDSAVRLYDTETGARVWSHVVKLNSSYQNYTSALAFSPDGAILAVCATDNLIHLINPTTGKEIVRLSGHQWYPWGLAFTSNSKMLYSSGWDAYVRRWDVRSRKQLPLPMGMRATGVIAASTDGRTLAYEVESAEIRLIDVASGKETRALALPGADYSRLTFSPDGQRLAGGGTCGEQVHVALWDLASGKLLNRWDWPAGRDPHSSVESLQFAPDGSRLAAAVFRQSTAYVWDLTTGQQISNVAHPSIYGLSFSPDGRTLVTTGWDAMIRFWDTVTGELRREDSVAQHDKVHDNGDNMRAYTVCYAPHGGVFATAHLDGTVRIWNAEPVRLQTTFQVPGRFVSGSVAFSPDGLWLATGSMDGSVSLWDPMTGTCVWNRGRHQGSVSVVAFGHDSQSLVSGGSDGLCYLWDVQPPDIRADLDLAHLWHDLVGEDGHAAAVAMFALCGAPDRAVAMLAENLRQVRNVVDLDRIAEGSSEEEAQRRQRLTRLLVEKDPKVKLAIGVKRAVSLMAGLGTRAAIDVLKNLAEQQPKTEVGRFATAALERSRAAPKP